MGFVRHNAHAAVATDAFDTFSATSAGTSFTKSFTVGSGSDRGLYIMVRNSNGNSVSSLTWNGTALSPVADSLIDTAWGHRIQWFHLANPDSGTHNVVLTLGSSDGAVFFIHSYSGVAQSGQPPTATTVQVVTQTQSTMVTLPISNPNDWALMGAWMEYSDQAIAATNATQRNSYVNVAYSWDSNGPVGSTTFSSNLSTSPYGRRWFVSMISIKPAPITPDAFDTFSATSAGTSFSKSFTVGSGSDRGLYIMVRNANGNSVSSLTWNGTALSAVADSLIDTAWGHRIQWFHLENPDSGTHNVVLTVGSSDSPVFFIHSYSGVAQSGQPATATTVQVVTQTQSTTVNLPISNSNDWALMGAWMEYSDQAIAATNATQRNSYVNVAYSWDSNGAVGSSTFSSDLSTSPYGRRWFVSMMSVKN